MQTTDDTKVAKLNRSQALIHLINANTTYLVAPRASGKTSGGIGPRLHHLSEVMPRCQIGLVSDKFERILDVLIPGIEHYLNSQLNLKEGRDYVKFRKPPENFIKPIFPISKYDHVITFATGVSLCLISLKVEGSANGYNLQALIGDEVKYFNEEKLKTEVFPAIRGGKDRWGHLAEFQSKWFFTDKWGGNIQWVLKKKNDMKVEVIDIIYTLQLELNILKEKVTQYTSSSTKAKYNSKIKQIQNILTTLRKNTTYYCDALPYENLENLGQKYFDDLKRDLTPYEYEVAIENKDPDRAVMPFYAALTPQVLYKRTYAFNPNKPLVIALDYQFSITPLGVAQFDKLPGNSYTSFNIILSLHKLYPLGIEAAIDELAEVVQSHVTKRIYYVFDHTAIARRSTGLSFKDTVIKRLREKGFKVTPIYMGDAPNHEIKFKQIAYWMNLEGDYALRIEEIYNAAMLKALRKASVIIKNGVTKKDKKSETDGKTPPEESTHYPDVLDQLCWAGCELKMIPMGNRTSMPTTLGAGR